MSVPYTSNCGCMSISWWYNVCSSILSGVYCVPLLFPQRLDDLSTPIDNLDLKGESETKQSRGGIHYRQFIRTAMVVFCCDLRSRQISHFALSCLNLMFHTGRHQGLFSIVIELQLCPESIAATSVNSTIDVHIPLHTLNSCQTVWEF